MNSKAKALERGSAMAAKWVDLLKKNHELLVKMVIENAFLVRGSDKHASLKKVMELNKDALGVILDKGRKPSKSVFIEVLKVIDKHSTYKISGKQPGASDYEDALEPDAKTLGKMWRTINRSKRSRGSKSKLFQELKGYVRTEDNGRRSKSSRSSSSSAQIPEYPTLDLNMDLGSDEETAAKRVPAKRVPETVEVTDAEDSLTLFTIDRAMSD